jgi:hypothetical protein
MSAIERYYSSLPVSTHPYCAEEEEDDAPMSPEEEAVYLEQCFRDF